MITCKITLTCDACKDVIEFDAFQEVYGRHLVPEIRLPSGWKQCDWALLCPTHTIEVHTTSEHEIVITDSSA